MKTIFFIPAAVLICILFLCCPTAGAQTVSGLEIPERTEDEKEFYRLAESPDKNLSIDDQILKYNLLLLVSKNYYIENGEIRTSSTEADFIRAGAKPSFYKIFTDQLDDMNRSLKKTGLSEKELVASLRENMKQNAKLEKFASQKLKNLKKKKQ